jgi:hypothetical protein
MRDNNFLNLRTSTNELRLAVVIPAAINARLSSASFKPQVITRKPANIKIATKTQVSKGIPPTSSWISFIKLGIERSQLETVRLIYNSNFLFVINIPIKAGFRFK